MTTPPPRYALVTWRTVQNHSVRVTADRLAELLDVPVGEVREAGDEVDALPLFRLGDSLAGVESGDTYDQCLREDITVELLCERCQMPSDWLDPDAGLCPACTANNDSRVVL